MNDLFVLNEWTENVFCPTGPGGGIDPTCSRGGSSISPNKVTEKDIQKLKAAGVVDKEGMVNLYHVTVEDRVEGIAGEGLIPGKKVASGQSFKAKYSSEGTYFHTDLSAAEANAEQAGKGAVVLRARIPATKEGLSRIIPDEDVTIDTTKGIDTLISKGSVVVLGGVDKYSIFSHAVISEEGLEYRKRPLSH